MVQNLTLALSKLSVLSQLYRVFGVHALPKVRWILRGLYAIVVIWFVGITTGEIFVCAPISANWDTGVTGRCGNHKLLRAVGAATWISTDFAILLVPIPALTRLQMDVRKKTGLVALFLTGGS